MLGASINHIYYCPSTVTATKPKFCEAMGGYAPPGCFAPSAPAVQSREHACELVAALLLVPLSVLGVCLESPHAQACIRAGYAHDLMHVTVSNVCGFRWQASGHISSEGSV